MWQCFPYIETSQLICIASQLTGFYMTAALAFNGLIANTANRPPLYISFRSRSLRFFRQFTSHVLKYRFANACWFFLLTIFIGKLFCTFKCSDELTTHVQKYLYSRTFCGLLSLCYHHKAFSSQWPQIKVQATPILLVLLEKNSNKNNGSFKCFSFWYFFIMGFVSISLVNKTQATTITLLS